MKVSLLSNRRLSRRTLLRGVGVSLALPWLDAMEPAWGVLSPSSLPPTRLAWIYIPNGVVQAAWHPNQPGRDWEVTPSLAPLARLRESLNVFTGLDREFRGGTGVHAQAGCCWLTSSPPSEALDGGFPTNQTLDQIIARRIGSETLLPSLELSCNDHGNQKETRYFETLSWRGPGYAASAQKNPREVFDRLFGKPPQSTRRVLDLILEDARRLRRQLGHGDQRKLDEYLESVHGIEQRIQRAERMATLTRRPEVSQPEGIPEDRGAYIRLMSDLIVFAFQQDRTRVATLLIDPERWDTPRMYDGVFEQPQNHHVLTHTKGDEAVDKLMKIDRFHVEQFAHMLERLRSIPERDGTLLDQCLVTLGSGMGDGRVHDYNNLPVITAGTLGGRIRTGQHLRYEGSVPLANLWLTMAQAVGLEQDSFADSNGLLTELQT